MSSSSLSDLDPLVDRLHRAVLEEDENEVILLIQLGVDVNRSHEDFTPLSLACSRGNLSIVKLIVAAGGEAVSAGPDCKTALHHVCASEKRTPEIIDIGDLLLSKGSPVDAKDNMGKTALFFACEADDLKLVQFLVASGCDVNVQTVCGESPMKVSCKNAEYWFYWHGRDSGISAVNISPNPRYFPPVEIAKVLLQAGTDMTEATFLPTAVQCGFNDLVKELLDIGMDVNLLDDSRRTPLGVACSTKSVNHSIVKLLLQHGADVNKAGGWKKQKPIILAYVHNSVEKLKILLSYGAEVSADEMTELVSLTLSKSILENPEVVGPWSRELLGWRLLLAAGCKPFIQGPLEFKMHQLSICSSYHLISPWIKSLFYPVHSLKDWCRISLRRRLPVSINDSIQLLPLPTTIKDFLCFKDFINDGR